jgi:hypothetical protein
MPRVIEVKQLLSTTQVDNNHGYPYAHQPVWGLSICLELLPSEWSLLYAGQQSPILTGRLGKFDESWWLRPGSKLTVILQHDGSDPHRVVATTLQAIEQAIQDLRHVDG